jgi:hypothetical protein
VTKAVGYKGEAFMKSWTIVVLSICIAASVVFGASDIYVSPTGNDGAAGTLAAPLATLTAARDKADQLKATNPPVTIYLRAGTYYLTAPVVFGPANSGTANAPIVYRSYPGEKAIISGGIKLNNPTWTVSSGSIMVTTIGANLKVDQLFLNGQRQVMARYPNYTAGQRLDGYAADAISATKVGQWANPAEGPGYIRALHNSEWGSVSYIITGKNGTAVTSTWVGDNNRGSVMNATYRMVENIFEELNAAGEWFYRKSTGQLFFWPPNGTVLNTSTIELASQDELLRFVGTSNLSANSVKYIQFNNIVFTHTYRTLFSKPYETVLKSDWGIARAGAIFMQNAENIRIENCTFDQVGGNGIFVSGYNRNHVIYNNVFNYGGASCVAIMGLNSAVRCPNSWSTTPTCSDRAPGPLTNEYPAYIKVDNNMMSYPGRFEKQPAGVTLSRTECDTVRHNTVHDCPRAGINFCDGCWGGHVVEYNWVYNAVLETGDHGPFNAWGRDRNERWPDDLSAVKLDAVNTTIIRINRLEARPMNFGIDLDDQSCNYHGDKNLLIGVGTKLQQAHCDTFTNNILVRGGASEIHHPRDSTKFVFAHNIIVGPDAYSISGSMTGGWAPTDIKRKMSVLDSNVLYNSGNAPNICPVYQRGSVYCTWAEWQAGGLDVHSNTADPLFTDTTRTWPNYAPRGDFSVRAGSPALTAGFKNFPMDSFGVMGTPGVAVQNPFIESKARESAIGNINVHYSAGCLAVSYDGEYQMTITTALGRTVKTFNGKNRSSFKIDATSSGAGVYVAVVRTKNGAATRRFIVK